ncbi:NADP-dependent oxidoreductase [Gammaproteobacteria bacterium]|nr:NADP-dependent oxidoreductase [Gammaproteobacteria bacterium]
MNYQNKQWLLNKRPNGMPDDDCWKLKNQSITSISKNEILIKVDFLSIDPYMRGRMNDSKSYADPAKLGEPMTGETVGTVVESNSSKYIVGDRVCAHQGWQTYVKVSDRDPSLFKVGNNNIPLQSYLGTVGMPGRTAYFGLNYVGKPKRGETLVVSAASGAVGTVVGQLGKEYGLKVIGIAGGDIKCSYVKDELGFDACIDYKSESFVTDLQNACSDGIDIYFENVGGDVTKAIAPLLNKGARVPICGYISQYNSTDIMKAETPFHEMAKLNPVPEHRFFVNTEWFDEWADVTSELSALVEQGKMKYRETITEGFENAPQGLRDVLTGKNFGKQIIKV